MKLLIGALALTMALTSACSKSDSSNKPGNSKPIDGNYVEFTPKGYTEDGVEHKSGGHVMNLMQIENGVLTLTEIDFDNQGYTVAKAVIDVNGKSASLATTSNSCVGGPGEISVKESGLGTRFNFEAVADEEKLSLSSDGSTDELLRVSPEQVEKIRSKIEGFKEYNEDSCKELPDTLDSAEPLEVIKSKLKELLE
ncbi:MAG: hypothetical protein V4596_12245 [Bdellovibrionota bacterium]